MFSAPISALRRLLVAWRSSGSPDEDRAAPTDPARPGLTHAPPLLLWCARARLGSCASGERRRPISLGTAASTRRSSRACGLISRRCNADLRHTLPPTRRFLRDEAHRLRIRTRRLEVAFGSIAPPRSSTRPPAGRTTVPVREDRPDRLTLQRPRDRADTIREWRARGGGEIDRELRPQIPLSILALRDLVGASRSAVSLARSPAGAPSRDVAGRRRRGRLACQDDYLPSRFGSRSTRRASVRAPRGAFEPGRFGTTEGDGCPAWCYLCPMCRVWSG